MLIKIGVGDRSHAQILGKKLILNNIERTSKIRTSQKRMAYQIYQDRQAILICLEM